jgi:hypothetical protein
MRVGCPYAKFGCRKRLFAGGELFGHQAKCPFRKIARKGSGVFAVPPSILQSFAGAAGPAAPPPQGHGGGDELDDHGGFVPPNTLHWLPGGDPGGGSPPHDALGTGLQPAPLIDEVSSGVHLDSAPMADPPGAAPASSEDVADALGFAMLSMRGKQLTAEKINTLI